MIGAIRNLLPVAASPKHSPETLNRNMRSSIPNRIAGALSLAAFLTSQTISAEQPSATPSGAERELARAIMADKRMDEVLRMGRELLKSGMNAGSGYREVWIRDLNTFIVPLLDVAPRQSVRDALITFFHFQGEDGNVIDGYVPKDAGNAGYKYRHADSMPGLKAHKNTVETDQESSLVQAVCRYITKTKDSGILDEVVRGIAVRRRVEMALEYPLKHRFSEKHGLVWGATTADWGDVQPEHEWGVELDESSHRAIDIYDNAMLVAAIGDFVKTGIPATDELKREWTDRNTRLRASIRDHLWDKAAGKFIPHIYLEKSPFPPDFDERGVFYHGGTTVAIEAGLLTPEEIRASYETMRGNVKRANAAGIGLTLYPPYPEGTFKNRSMTPYSYQNGGDWDWFGARTVTQLARAGLVREAYRELIPMLERAIGHNGFYEWWTPSNEPKGSGQFRGAAGVLIEAIATLRDWADARD